MPKPSKTDWERIKAMSDEDIDYSDIPPLDEEFWKNAILWPREKQQITLEPDVAAFFKSQGEGIQNTVNNVLRQYVESQKHIPVIQQRQRHKLIPR